jgi:hypothetical protein
MEKDITELKLALNLSDSHEKQVLLIEKIHARAISMISLAKLLLKETVKNIAASVDKFEKLLTDMKMCWKI